MGASRREGERKERPTDERKERKREILNKRNIEPLLYARICAGRSTFIFLSSLHNVIMHGETGGPEVN